MEEKLEIRSDIKPDKGTCSSKPGKLSRPRNYNEQGKSTLSKPSKLRP